jgi:hypothetical protein
MMMIAAQRVKTTVQVAWSVMVLRAIEKASIPDPALKMKKRTVREKGKYQI